MMPIYLKRWTKSEDAYQAVLQLVAFCFKKFEEAGYRVNRLSFSIEALPFVRRFHCLHLRDTDDRQVGLSRDGFLVGFTTKTSDELVYCYAFARRGEVPAGDDRGGEGAIFVDLLDVPDAVRADAEVMLVEAATRDAEA
jgi:hypothetical protein